jgi:hypothetical protein
MSDGTSAVLRPVAVAVNSNFGEQKHKDKEHKHKDKEHKHKHGHKHEHGHGDDSHHNDHDEHSSLGQLQNIEISLEDMASARKSILIDGMWRKGELEEDISIDYSLNRMMRTIWNDKDCKHLFLFTSLLCVVTFINILYGSWSSSLGT